VGEQGRKQQSGCQARRKDPFPPKRNTVNAGGGKIDNQGRLEQDDPRHRGFTSISTSVRLWMISLTLFQSFRRI